MTDPTEPVIVGYWGKAQPKDAAGQHWHPLAYHGLDVAAAGAILLEIRPRLLSALAHASGLPEDTARRWMLFALALHDIGKFADCFQCKVPELWRHRGAWGGSPVHDPGHGRTGRELWQRGCEIGAEGGQVFAPLFGRVSLDTADAFRHFSFWFGAVCGHHGRPVEPHILSDRICDEARADAAGRILTKTYPAATAENVTYTYDDVTSGNKGKGRLTRIASQNVIIDRVYDVRGNITSDKRTINAQVYTTTYEYDVADQLLKVNYPSGRIVTYYRDTTGRINKVTTKQNVTATSVTLSNLIVRPAHTNLITTMTLGNGLTDANTYNLDNALDVLRVNNGATAIINRSHVRGDALNLTGITNAVTPANSETFTYSAANRLATAAATGTGAYGARTWAYDSVGNRTSEVSTPVGGSATTRTFTYPATSNKPTTVMIGAATDRAFVHDAGGNITSDTRAGGVQLYTYNKRNRMDTATVGGVLKGTYTYNGLEQLAIRTTTNMTPSGTTHFIHDLMGNVIAETNGTAAGTVREYIWLTEAEIAPTFGSRARVDRRPLAVVNAVNTTPVTWFVHVDHLARPIKMTTATKASVWDAVWQPWGNVHTITGTAVLDARFPGQWFQLETGLHYNWNRSYDPSIGRYTQPDPLGFVDGPSMYGYARGNPQSLVDPDGQDVTVCFHAGGPTHISFGVNDGPQTGFYPKAHRSFSGPGEVKIDQPTSQCKVIKTSPQQDGCLTQCQSDRQSNPGRYNAATRQCTTYVRECLNQCNALSSGANRSNSPGPWAFYWSLGR
jgi:CRISPR-associated endonuclease Cas3-HD